MVMIFGGEWLREVTFCISIYLVVLHMVTIKTHQAVYTYDLGALFCMHVTL